MAAAAAPFAALPCLLLLLLLPSIDATSNVTYDHRSLIIDGRRRLVISTSIHYPRSVPEMWPKLVAEAKDGGADCIETYVFWNGHEIAPGQYYFEDRFDLVRFVKIVRDAGLLLILRIGPFVAAEWNFGGVPVWLHYVPGTVFRTNNEPFKVRSTCRFHGVSTIENEYGGYLEEYYGPAGKAYAMWAASMALAQNTGVPWIMCQQPDAPNPVINTCNSFYCDTFQPNSPTKPKFWTENWPGWFQTFGESNPHRPPEDVAFAVARFFEKGGSVQNYYVYHGGTNFGRTTGGPFITTSYDYDAPIDEYGLALLQLYPINDRLRRFPKWAHLKELHKSIKLCEHTLLYGNTSFLSLGPKQEADIYTDQSGGCVAFLANIDSDKDKVVTFRNRQYDLPAWSVSILPDCKNVVFNTAKVQSQTSMVVMVPESLQALKPDRWSIFRETTGIWGKNDFIQNGFVDHINTTKDTTDYLWYTTSFSVDGSYSSKGSQAVLNIDSKGHGVHAFLNNELIGSAYGNGSKSSFTVGLPINLRTGKNDLALLSMTVGLQIGLEGEYYSLFKPDQRSNKRWIPQSEPPKNQPLTWYKVNVDVPQGDDPVGIDMQSMGKGLAWLNGNAIGRYWPRTSSTDDRCTPSCNYRGTFDPDKCRTGCGQPTQRWYHVPRSWFHPSGNTLVVFEEKGGDPTKITFSRRVVSSVCSFVSEHYPSIDVDSWDKSTTNDATTAAKVQLSCPKGKNISSVKFASLGNPSGTCRSYQKGSCHHPNSLSVVEKACLNTNSCTVSLSDAGSGDDLCPGVTKTLAVEADCS
ncbi:beta-galactosidase 3 [Panicum miliaceum]|uniref:beta-galactosidase n=1 Tax=Panicum miliaceum TaxID=4540 RepID=A0A3L6RML5_PANMI|nr:beta-galactosidase 3 [Panicum miliaceum]